MASSMFVVGVTLKAFDQMSGVLGNAQRNLTGLQKKLEGVRASAERFGRAGLADGLIVGAGLQKTVSAFSDLEDASTRLKVAMTDKNGVAGAFEQVNALAVKMGDRLPGTTADFLGMMAVLKKFGISDKSILGGLGEATANIAVMLKMTPDAAAAFAAKMKEATGTADKDMLGLMDTIQRVYHQGVDPSQMMLAFARSAGALNAVKVQGLEATREMSALYAILIKTGTSGETIGTGTGTILNALQDTKKMAGINAALKARKGFTLDFTDKKGNFLGVENMVAQFDKLKQLDPGQLNRVLMRLFGGGQDMQMVSTLISNGTEGYRKMLADMERQADLRRRIDMQLGTLANLWEAASGTFTNALAAFAETFAPELKTLTEWFNALSVGVSNFIKSHPLLSKWIGLATLGFVTLALSLGGFALVLAGALRYVALIGTLAPTVLFAVGAFAKLLTIISAVGAFMLANPITIAIVLLAAAAGLIYENWEPIKAFFTDLWTGVKEAFNDAWNWISSKISSVPEWMKNIFGGGRASGGFAPNQPRMAPAVPGVARSNTSVDVGGRTDIYVHDDRVTVKSAPNDKRMALNVYTGRYMAGAN